MISFGSKGRIEFSIFGDTVHLITEKKTESFSFKPLRHIQQPVIATTKDYFLGKTANPCSAEEGLKVAKIMDTFCVVRDL
jgi:hypothetical protein